MHEAIRVLYLLLTFLLLVLYHTISSLVRAFIPRSLRRKKNIKGQRVLITGAGSGVGRELAIEFSKQAVCLILVDINKPSLLQTEKLLDRRSSVFVYDCDVSNYKKVCEMAKKVQKEAGDVDILVNNAGVVSGNYLLDIPEEKIVKTMGVNALAHFWTCKAFLPAMMEKNRGHIVSVISIVAKCGAPRVTDYCSSKFAAYGFAETLAIELKHQMKDGIKITMVCPSMIDTGLFKGAKMRTGGALSPSYVAKEIVAGVLEEEEIIYLPFYYKHLLMVKDLIPLSLAIKFFHLTGEINAMDNFVGRDGGGNGIEMTNMAKKAE